MKVYLCSLALLVSLTTFAQKFMNSDTIPYAEIPPSPIEYTPGTVAARVIDGLGYRYYWATEGLRSEDLAFKPSEDARNTMETLDHIYGLTLTIRNSLTGKPESRPENWMGFTLEEKRSATLQNIKHSSELLNSYDVSDIEKIRIMFRNSLSNFPFWNLLNGMISDAIYHVGQVVSFRRSSGNPMNPNVNVLLGKTND